MEPPLQNRWKTAGQEPYGRYEHKQEKPMLEPSASHKEYNTYTSVFSQKFGIRHKFSHPPRNACNNRQLCAPGSSGNHLLLPPILTQILKRKNHYRRRSQRLGIPIFRYLAHIVTQIFLVKLQPLKNAKWNSFLRTLHPQKPSFWKVTRYFTTTKQTIPPLLHNGTQLFRPLEKAEELARQFERAHNLTLHMSTPHHSQIITRTVNKVFRHPISPATTIQPTNPHEIWRKILSLKPRSAPGNDKISPILLRHLSTHAVSHLALIFNSIFKLGYFPTIWKAAKVIPILKPKKPPPTLTPIAPSAS